MVKLYGAYHGGEIECFFIRKQLRVFPSQEILQELSELPEGTKIGIEGSSPEDKVDIQKSLDLEIEKAGIKEEIRFSSDEYWQIVSDACSSRGKQIIFLEDNIDVWKRYNQAIVQSVIFSRKEFNPVKGESDSKYHERRCRFSEEELRIGLNMRNIHEIERDYLLLKSIREKQVDVAIVGMAHSEYWMANRHIIEPSFGLRFESYATDKIVNINDRRLLDFPDVTARFIRNPSPEMNFTRERQNLERSVGLMMTGRIIQDRLPDYVGTWKVTTPSEGYFEMFVESREGNFIKGTIEDCLGTATFDGQITEDSISFNKHYTENSTSDVIKSMINYEAKMKEKQFYGYYGDLFKKAFYMVQANREDPITMFLNWFRLVEESKKEVQRVLEKKLADMGKEDFSGDLPF